VRKLKTAAMFAAFAVVVIGTIALWGARWAPVTGPVAPHVVPKTETPAFEGGMRSVTLFFVGRGDYAFREERREIERGAITAEEAKRTLAELARGPGSADLAPTVPREARLYNLFIDSSGTAYVNFSKELRDGLSGGAQEELYAVFSIVNTLASNFPRIARVQILVEGAEIQTLAGHVDTRGALQPQYVF